MKIFKKLLIIFLTIAILIFNRNSVGGSDEWVSSLIIGVFVAYGIQSRLDKIE